MLIDDALKHPESKVLVISYSGLGDAILCGPILRDLSRSYPGRVLYLDNPVLSLYKALDVEGLNDVEGVGRELRRFMDFAFAELLAHLRGHNVGAILNLRRDRVKFREEYEALSRAVNEAGVLLADVCESVPVGQQTRMHTFDLCARFMRRLGRMAEPHRFGWLKDGVRARNWRARPRGGVGFFVGAGQEIKRMPPEFWRGLIGEVYARSGMSIVVLCGLSPEEYEQGERLSRMLAEDGVAHELVSGLPLVELTQVVGGMHLIVSCDTFMVHLAEALGVRVVGVYCSTDPRVYGPYHGINLIVRSSYYPSCPHYNQIGNCDGWDIGCTDTPCKNFVSVGEAVSRSLESLAACYTIAG